MTSGIVLTNPCHPCVKAKCRQMMATIRLHIMHALTISPFLFRLGALQSASRRSSSSFVRGRRSSPSAPASLSPSGQLFGSRMMRGRRLAPRHSSADRECTGNPSEQGSDRCPLRKPPACRACKGRLGRRDERLLHEPSGVCLTCFMPAYPLSMAFAGDLGRRLRRRGGEGGPRTDPAVRRRALRLGGGRFAPGGSPTRSMSGCRSAA